MPRTPTNDNTPRPAWYDAKLLEHRRFLNAMARKYGVPRAEREELVQDTCLRALRKWSVYNPEFAFSTWLNALMKNEMKNRWLAGRAAMRSGQHVDIDIALLSIEPEQEKGLRLYDALRHLPDGREGVIIRRRLLGETQPEIAADLGVTRQRVQEIEKRGVSIVRKRVRQVRVAA